ncbi:FAD-dependent oxidoreductase [Patescibacteria group bacterium]|nr:FAD-dependent oxidoreductase [Patescibacteria group bacterium]
MTQPDSALYDIVIIGGGASGTSLLYTLAHYTNVQRIALLEKYARPGQVNSKATNNSQTLHVGDIETNYSLDKVRQVKPAAMMVARYANQLPSAERSEILFPVQKMVLGVGREEVASLEKRFSDLRELFPDLKKLTRADIEQVEPNVVKGRSTEEPIIALCTNQGYGVDFERLAQSFIDHAKQDKPDLSVRFNSQVESIVFNADKTYTLNIKDGTSVTTKALVVNADSYSLLLAKQLGYGQHFSLIPIAGTFYFSKKLLNGKVYTVQEPRLPFAAVHGDPDVRVADATRWGPTARFHPVLESRNFKTSLDYLRSSGLGNLQTWVSFFKILLDPVRFKYLLKNMLYELPWIGTRLFVENVKKIIPTIRASDLQAAEGYGGMRLQRVDTNTHELQLGEGKIVGENSLFNMTPSPGASVCLYNAMRDAEKIMEFLNHTYQFESDRMRQELFNAPQTHPLDAVSLPEGYAS